MVSDGRNEGNWRAYLKAARAKLKKALPWSALIVIVPIAFDWGENVLGDNFHDCVNHEQQQYKEGREIHKKEPPPIHARVDIQFVCSVQLIDRHNGFFALLGTIAVAGFTLALWLSTEKLWRSGERQMEIARTAANAALIQAQASMAAERAYTVIPDKLDESRTFFIINVGRTLVVFLEMVVCAYGVVEDKNWVNGLDAKVHNMGFSVKPGDRLDIFPLPTDASFFYGRLLYIDVYKQRRFDWFRYDLVEGVWIANRQPGWWNATEEVDENNQPITKQKCPSQPPRPRLWLVGINSR